jgi:RmlD substrate binding domain
MQEWNSMLRVAVIGAKGQLGSDLVSRLGAQAIPLGHADIDISEASSISFTLDRDRPDVVINCAAYNFVDGGITVISRWLSDLKGEGNAGQVIQNRLKFL